MPRAPVDIKDLECFIAVYESRAFSKAASVLLTAQSNVSTRIGALERHLGVMLFERRYRGIVPTLHGSRFYAAARRVVVALKSLERQMRVKRRLLSRVKRAGRSRSR